MNIPIVLKFSDIYFQKWMRDMAIGEKNGKESKEKEVEKDVEKNMQ